MQSFAEADSCQAVAVAVAGQVSDRPASRDFEAKEPLLLATYYTMNPTYLYLFGGVSSRILPVRLPCCAANSVSKISKSPKFLNRFHYIF
jgi:hypothetical protein